MYLSRVALNVSRRETMNALHNPQQLHAAVACCFPPPPSDRPLWRIDRIDEAWYLMVCSPGKPDMRHIVQQFGWPAAEQDWETRDYAPLLNRLAPGQIWQFRLRGNACKCQARPGEKRGVMRPLVTVPDQMKWLQNRAEKHGFKLDPEQFCVVRQDTLDFRNKTQPITLRAAVYEGRLQVTDAELLKSALTGGIGRGKAYGCGLLTVIPT